MVWYATMAAMTTRTAEAMIDVMERGGGGGWKVEARRGGPKGGEGGRSRLSMLFSILLQKPHVGMVEGYVCSFGPSRRFDHAIG